MPTAIDEVCHSNSDKLGGSKDDSSFVVLVGAVVNVGLVFSKAGNPHEAGSGCSDSKLHYAIEILNDHIRNQLTYNIPGDRTFHFIQTEKKKGYKSRSFKEVPGERGN